MSTSTSDAPSARNSSGTIWFSAPSTSILSTCLGSGSGSGLGSGLGFGFGAQQLAGLTAAQEDVADLLADAVALRARQRQTNHACSRVEASGGE